MTLKFSLSTSTHSIQNGYWIEIDGCTGLFLRLGVSCWGRAWIIKRLRKRVRHLINFPPSLPGLSPLGYSHVAPARVAMHDYVAKSKHTENKVRYSNLPRPTKWSGLDSAKTKPFIFSPWHMVSNRVCALLPAGVGEGWKLALHKDVYSAIAAPSSEQELTRR
jgi:hypothetical protein